MKTNILSILSVVLLSALMIGCGSGSKNEVLYMVTEATFPPYEFRQGDDIVGIEVDIVKEIAKELGRPLKMEDMKFDSVIPCVQSGKADFAASGITVTEDRKKNVDFSIPFVKTGLVIVCRKDAPVANTADLKGKTIGVQSSSTSDIYVTQNICEPDRYENAPLAVQALRAKRVDAVVCDQDPAYAMAKNDDSIMILPELLTEEEYAIAFKKGSPLVEAANKVIERMKADGSLEASLKKWRAEMPSAD